MCERRYLPLRWPRRRNRFGYVARHQRSSHSLLERLVQRHVYDLHRTRGQAGVQLLAVHVLDLQGVELVELHASYRRLEVESHHLLVPLPGALPDGTLECPKPPVEVVAHGQVLAVVSDALVPVRQQFTQLGPYFCLRLAGDIPALSVSILVLAYAAPLLPPIDAALSLVPPFLGHLSSDRLSNRLSKPSKRTGGPRQ